MARSERNIRIAFLLNLAFTLLEFAGGFFTNSLAIMADALHDLGDSFSLGLAWFLERIAQRKRSSLFSYGYKRFSLLSALINAIVLILGSVLILLFAIPRLFEPQPVYSPGMLVLAVIGVVVNGIAALRVHGGQTMNEKMVAWHLAEDALGWVGVLLVSILIYLFQLPVLDPLLSIGITLFILINVIRNFRKTVIIFLQGVPPSIAVDMVEQELLKIPGVVGIHDTHIWSMDGEHHILTTHLVTEESSNYEQMRDIKCAARENVAELGISHATIELEKGGETCMLEEDW
jgi:cobalt-zinc-cadmium efflux system protein